GNSVKTSSTLSVGSDLSKEGGGDEGFSGVSSLLPDELNGQRGVSLIVSKIAPKISPNIHKPEKVEDFIARFEDETGRKTFDLSAPQEASNILETGRAEKKKKEHEEKKFLTYSEDKKRIDESLNNINSLNGSFNDFFELKKKAPKIFEAVKSSYGIDVPLDEIEDTPNKEDKYVSRIANAYKSAAAEQKLEFFRQRRSEIGTEIESTLPSASEFTGKEYSNPTSLDEAKKIISDINDKKAAMMAIISNSDLSPSEWAFQVGKANGEIEKGQKVLPSLRKIISGFVFDEESKNNPNVSPFEVGKKIYSIIDPQGYDLYVQAGGDKMYRAGGGFGQGYSDTPKKADAINRRITEYGIDAFQTFGNKAAIEKAGDENNFLKWKFTKPIEEETKHMIAAQLFAQGIKPNKATDEMKDAIAETLPQTNKDVWFNSNKPGNNTALPSSGFWYSIKESYNQTVEDASKILLGWMMPGRGRERALDILEQQGTSNIVGENPESKARLYALKQKEKQGALTADEIKEKEALSQFTDVRTNWQKFKDLSGSGVGQFTGFGTISAFTGGLGNAKNAATAVKALVSPMADREGMLIGGYLMSREGNARDVVAMFPGENDGVKRFVAGEVFSFIDTYIERLFPEEKFLSISVKKDIAKLLPKLTADNIRKELNVSLAEKVAKTFVKKLAAQQGTPLQEATEEMVAAKIKDVFHGILDPDREAITFDEILNIGTQSYLSTQVIGVPKGLMATRNKTVPINAIWDAASTKGGYGDVMHTILEMQQKGDLTMDQANERISLLKTARKHWEDSPVLSGNLGNLSVPKKQNYLARLMNESVLQQKADAATDENVKKNYNKEISESEKIRAKIFNGELDVTERNNEKPVAAEIKKEDDKWKKNIVAIEERTDISDIEKERLKQMEDDRHAGEVSTITKNLNNNKQAAPIFTDFDDTVFKDGKLTDIGLSLKEKAANGEDVVVLTARDPTPENIKFIAEQLGIPEMSVKAGLTPDGKAAQLVPGSTYYNENDIELAEGSKVKGVNVVDVKTFKPSLTIEEVEDNLATSLPEYKTKDAIGFVNEMVDGEVIPDAYAKDAKASPLAFLQGVADQALGFTRDSKGNRIKADGKIPDVNSQYTETVIEYAKSLFPEVAILNETKDWGSLSMEEKRKLATENLPEVTDDNTEQEIIDLANNNAKFLLAKMRG
ncbi:MAG TPA: hypothetical protein PLO99_11970, partial [Chitinophagaceae bacterium]|nr:hypothetical protein [Chitinophagaceae bacterium]